MEDRRADLITPIQLWLIVISVSAFVASNIVAVKIISIGGHNVPGGAVVFPITFLVDDAIVEVYGYRAARRAIWMGFFASLVMVAAIELVLWLPAAPFWENQAAYEDILGLTWRLVLASFISYLIGTFANAVIMSRLKVATEGRALWLRTIGSTLVGQGLDTVVFVGVAFGGTIAGDDLRRIMVTAWAFKCLYEVVCTPLVYVVVNRLKAIEGVDTFDRDVDYSPIPRLHAAD